MKIEQIINSELNYKITLIISDEGYCFCPVCGEKSNDLEWRPYDKEGYPSYDICGCNFEYGFDDGGIPPYENKWENYRLRWLNNKIENERRPILSLQEKIKQLKNIGIEITKS